MGSTEVILLDTHIWFWWVRQDPLLPAPHSELLERSIGNTIIGVSAISCWEIAMAVERGRMEIDLPVVEWLTAALRPSGIDLLPLTPQIAYDSVALPAPFHRDPADQIIVATARIHKALLLTVDSKILAYPHVQAS